MPPNYPYSQTFYSAALKIFGASSVSAVSHSQFVFTVAGKGLVKWNYPTIHNPIKAEANPELRHQILRATYRF
jgi:hypothetical protein